MPSHLFVFLGTDDSINTCDCCGKKNLASTVAIENTETGDVVHYGCVCAARALKITVQEVRAGTKAADYAREQAAKLAAEQAAAARFDAWIAWLTDRAGAGIARVNYGPTAGAVDILGTARNLGTTVGSLRAEYARA